MPSLSKSQWRLMAAAAKDAKFAKKFGIDQKVAKEFHDADTHLLKIDPEHYDNLPETSKDLVPHHKKESTESSTKAIFGEFKMEESASLCQPPCVGALLVYDLVSRYLDTSWEDDLEIKDGCLVSLDPVGRYLHFSIYPKHFLSAIQIDVIAIIRYLAAEQSTRTKEVFPTTLGSIRIVEGVPVRGPAVRLGGMIVIDRPTVEIVIFLAKRIAECLDSIHKTVAESDTSLYSDGDLLYIQVLENTLCGLNDLIVRSMK